MLKRRTTGRGHVTLCSPMAVKAVQETILLGHVEVGDRLIWMQVETGSETADVCIPLSNVAGIEWEEPAA